MIDTLIGWAVTHQPDAHLLRTTDGGTRWNDVTPPSASGQQAGVGAVAVLSSLIAWAATGSADGPRISHTVDGGRTWNSAPISLGRNDALAWIQFINPRDGWLLSITGIWMANEAVDIYRSADGGKTWIRVASAAAGDESSGLSTGGSKGALTFLSATTGWIPGSTLGPGFQYLYVTHDGGRTWRPQQLPLPPQVTSPWYDETMAPTFFTTEEGILPVFYSIADPQTYHAIASVAVFYVTHDGGATWMYATPVPVTHWGDPSSFADVNHGWMTEDDALYVTSDGGRQWTTIRPTEPFADVKQLDFISPKVGWAVSRTFPWLLKTLDGGRTWAPVAYTISRQ